VLLTGKSNSPRSKTRQPSAQSSLGTQNSWFRSRCQTRIQRRSKENYLWNTELHRARSYLRTRWTLVPSRHMVFRSYYLPTILW